MRALTFDIRFSVGAESRWTRCWTGIKSGAHSPLDHSSMGGLRSPPPLGGDRRPPTGYPRQGRGALSRARFSLEACRSGLSRIRLGQVGRRARGEPGSGVARISLAPPVARAYRALLERFDDVVSCSTRQAPLYPALISCGEVIRISIGRRVQSPPATSQSAASRPISGGTTWPPSNSRYVTS